jgi:hypothetical protein
MPERDLGSSPDATISDACSAQTCRMLSDVSNATSEIGYRKDDTLISTLVCAEPVLAADSGTPR